MYQTIRNPSTGRNVSIYGNIGQQILRNYIFKLKRGGSPREEVSFEPDPRLNDPEYLRGITPTIEELPPSPEANLVDITQLAYEKLEEDVRYLNRRLEKQDSAINLVLDYLMSLPLEAPHTARRDEAIASVREALAESEIELVD